MGLGLNAVWNDTFAMISAGAVSVAARCRACSRPPSQVRSTFTGGMEGSLISVVVSVTFTGL